MIARKLALCVVLGCVAGLSSGCALTELRNTNRRLKEANNRLVSENNRLEQELAVAGRAVSDRARELAELQDLLRQPPPAPPPAEPEKPLEDPGEFSRIGLETGTNDQGRWVRLDSAVFFPLGKASLSDEGRRILDQVVLLLNRDYHSRMIRVEGHTDDTPIRRVRDLYPTNWELSTARACAVVRYLESKGLGSERVYPAGYSFHRPRAVADTKQARELNRRVEILILNDGTT